MQVLLVDVLYFASVLQIADRNRKVTLLAQEFLLELQVLVVFVGVGYYGVPLLIQDSAFLFLHLCEVLRSWRGLRGELVKNGRVDVLIDVVVFALCRLENGRGDSDLVDAAGLALGLRRLLFVV